MLRYFPIISNLRRGMCVLFEDAEKAFETYTKSYPGQTMEDIFARGGFGVEEFVYYYHGLSGPETGVGWSTDVCPTCKGLGDVILSEHSGMLDFCWKCLGVGALLPKEHPGVKI